MKTSDYLKKALNILETEGWIKLNYHSDSGYCAVGALAKSTEYAIEYTTYKAALCYLCGAIPFHFEYYDEVNDNLDRVGYYNDSNGFQEIKILYQKAILAAEKDENNVNQ